MGIQHITIPAVPVKATPQKTAHFAVSNARRAGILKHEGECAMCSEFVKNQNYQAHHDDYSKPFEVIMLCCRCHRERHRQLGWGVSIAKSERRKNDGSYALMQTALRRLLGFYESPDTSNRHTHYVFAKRVYEASMKGPGAVASIIEETKLQPAA